MSNTYSSVDNATDVVGALDWQDRINQWPQIAAYKQRSLALVSRRNRVLDIGCCTGQDLLALGDRAIGADASAAMCVRAASRGATVVQSNGEALPFPEGAFDAVRADRVIQHLLDPSAAIAEMVRVTRPGGLVVICDPDQESLVIALPGVHPSLTAAVKRLRRDVGYRNGTYVTRLPAMLHDLGLTEITVDSFPLLLTNPDDAFGLPNWPRFFSRGDETEAAPTHPDATFTSEELEEWDRGIVRARASGGMVYALLYFVVSAVR